MDDQISSFFYSRRKFIFEVSRNIGIVTFALNGISAFSSCGTSSESKRVEHIKEQEAQKKLGIALVGLGNYSTNELAPALEETKYCYLSGIVTGTPAKAKKWKRKYNIP